MPQSGAAKQREPAVQSKPAVQSPQAVSVRKEEPSDLVAHVRDLYDRIALRAFEIFDGSGRLQGRDLADWFQAEMEFLHPMHMEVSESSGALTVRAEVPGFKGSELQINVEPRRVTIAGKRETKAESKGEKAFYSETCSDQILRVFELPIAVDPEKVKATLEDGVLVLEMPKVPPSTPVKAESAGA